VNLCLDRRVSAKRLCSKKHLCAPHSSYSTCVHQGSLFSVHTSRLTTFGSRNTGCVFARRRRACTCRGEETKAATRHRLVLPARTCRQDAGLRPHPADAKPGGMPTFTASASTAFWRVSRRLSRCSCNRCDAPWASMAAVPDRDILADVQYMAGRERGPPPFRPATC
jgi:hypothetical protein